MRHPSDQARVAAESRVAQGLSATVTDPAAVARIVVLLTSAVSELDGTTNKREAADLNSAASEKRTTSDDKLSQSA